MPAALKSLSAVGGRSLGYWRSDWASDYDFFFAHEYPDVESLQKATCLLRKGGFFRYLASTRVLGQRWGGEPGWKADQW